MEIKQYLRRVKDTSVNGWPAYVCEQLYPHLATRKTLQKHPKTARDPGKRKARGVRDPGLRSRYPIAAAAPHTSAAPGIGCSHPQPPEGAGHAARRPVKAPPEGEPVAVRR